METTLSTYKKPLSKETLELSGFDVEEFLTSKGIDCKKETRACINVCCPFCSDSGYHCGVFLDYKNYNCWRCGASGPFVKLVMVLFHVSYQTAVVMIGNEPSTKESGVVRIRRILSGEEAQPVIDLKEIPLPKEAKLVTRSLVEKSPVLKNFLGRRKISLEVCVERKAHFCRYGEYTNRLIIPIIFHGKSVGFTARDVTNCPRAVRYLSSSGLASDQLLYGWDDFQGDHIILVEGPLDCWALGGISLACLGSSISIPQEHMIMGRGARQVSVVFDSDIFTRIDAAHKRAKLSEVASRMLISSNCVKIVRLPDGQDPSSFGRDRTLEWIQKTQPWKGEPLEIYRSRI